MAVVRNRALLFLRIRIQLYRADLDISKHANILCFPCLFMISYHGREHSQNSITKDQTRDGGAVFDALGSRTILKKEEEKETVGVPPQQKAPFGGDKKTVPQRPSKLVPRANPTR